MANKDDYLTEYRQFFEKFANTVEPNDQLPVKLGSYKFINTEVVGGIVDWCLQYLTRKSCPSSLVSPLIKTTIDEIRQACKKHPVACGFNPNDNVYEPLKLMQTVMGKMNEVCLRYLDNSALDTLPAPQSPVPQVSVCASRNTRRRMEDRHVIIHDLNTMFNIEDSSSSCYYAIFDGHAGPDAASYSAAHLHQFIAESQYYPTDPQRALKEAFLKTDEFFLEKSRVENFRSGTTAVCALLRPKQQTLYVAWVGDSQALLVNRGKVLQIVKPHKPSRKDEKERIEANGGCVMYWGMWRVNGQLAVSRAIGDLKLKPYVIAEPDVAVVPLDGDEEFLIMACDGLWDFVSEDDAALEVYNRVRLQPDNIEDIGEHLVSLAKRQGSRDNISVIVVFLKEPDRIAKQLQSGEWWPGKSSHHRTSASASSSPEEDMDNSNNATNNAFDLFDVFHKKPNLMEMDTTDFKPNGQSPDNLFYMPSNGKRPADFDSEDFGPETDVDAIDDVLLSPTIAKARQIVQEITNNNPPEEDKLEIDLELKGPQDIEELMKAQRDETPTPPADSVLDSSGIADNVAEGSEDSEDEWNYYRVDPKKENSDPVETVVKVSESGAEAEDSNEMSQLNPDAAEFVPVSPTRVVASPTYLPDLDDKLLAQSPRRALPMDINVPSPVEFQSEVKNRPSEVFDEFDKCENTQNGHQMSTQELMQNFLNGKDINEIEFHPQNYVKSVDDVTQGELICGVTEELNVSGVMETVASPIESQKEEFSPNFTPKEQDPMNMSFYQDKDEENTFSNNPFDLNKVQMLPDEEEVSDSEEKSVEIAKEKISPVPKEKVSSPVLEVHTPEITSPAGPLSPKSPIPELTELVSPDITASIKDENIEIAKSPLSQHSTATPVDNVLKSPEIEADVEVHQQPKLNESPIGEIIEETHDEISKDAGKEIHYNDVITEEPKIVLEDIVKEVEKDTANFMGDACKFSDNIYISEKLDEFEVIKGDAENVMEREMKLKELNFDDLEPVKGLPEVESQEINAAELSKEITGVVEEMKHSFMNFVTEHSPRDEIELIKEDIQERCVTPHHDLDEIIESKVEQVETAIAEAVADLQETISSMQEMKESDVAENVIEKEMLIDTPSNMTLEFFEDLPEVESKILEPEIACELVKEPENIPSELLVETVQEAIEIIQEPIEKIPEPIEKIPEPVENIPEPIVETIQEAAVEAIEELAVEAIQEPIESIVETIQEPVVEAVQKPDESIPEPIVETIQEPVVEVVQEAILSVQEPVFETEPVVESIQPVEEVLEPTEIKTEVELVQFESKEEPWKCVYPLPTQNQLVDQDIDIKRELITPEFAVPTLASPVEESKGLETPPTTPAVFENETKSPEPQQIVEAVEKLNEEVKPEVVAAIAITAAAGVTAAGVAVAAKPKPRATIASKKPTGKVSPTSPTKPPTKTTLLKKTSTTSATKPPSRVSSAPLKAPLTKTPVSSPKPPVKTTPKPPTPKPITKPSTTTTKPPIKLMNGDTKPLAKAPAKRPVSSTLLKEKTSPTTTRAPASRPSPRPTTAPAKAPPARPPVSATPKPRPATLTKSTMVTAKTSSSTTTKAAAPAKSPSRPIAAVPKPRTSVTSTAAPKPMARSTLTARAPAKTADSQKLAKDTANKQVKTSATRTVSATSRTTTTTTTKKIEAKVPGAKTITKTSTTTIKSSSLGKKPEVSKTTITKTNGVSKIPPQQNGVVNVIQEITTVTVVDEPLLVKDNSPLDTPVVIDNSQLD